MAVTERLGLHFDNGIISISLVPRPDAALPFEQAEAERAAAIAEEARLARVAVGLAALEALPVLEEQGIAYARCADVFGGGWDGLLLPLNPKTTEHEVLDVPLTELEPSQELVAIGGLRKYIESPRRDRPDVARVFVRDRVRWVVQDGHTRLGAARLRGEATYPATVWSFRQAADGTYEPVTRGLQKRGEQKRMGLSFREDGVLALSRTVFHGTPTENLERIKAAGLCPTPASPLHFAPDEDTAAAWGGLRAKERGDGTYIVLRVRTAAALRDNGQGELIASETIPPDDIEMKVGDAWRPIHMDDGGGGDAGGGGETSAGNPAPSLPYSYPSVLKGISVQLQPTQRKRKFARTPKRFEMSLLSLREVPQTLDTAEARIADRLLAALPGLDPERSQFSADSVAEVGGVLLGLVAFGAHEVVLEFSRQGVTVPEIDLFDVTHAVHELSTSLGETLHASWQRAVAKVEKRKMPEAARPGIVKALVERDAAGAVKRLSANAGNAAYALGRRAQQYHVSLKKDDFPIDLSEIDVVQTNIMDKNTCAHCADVNGEVMTYGSARMYELEPPYILCLGEDRCRCHQLALVPGHGAIDREDISDEELEDLLQE